MFRCFSLFVLLQIMESPEDMEGMFGKPSGDIHKIIAKEAGDDEFMELVLH